MEYFVDHTASDKFVYIQAGYTALASCAAQCIVICPVCVFACLQWVGGQAVSEPYYSQRVRSVCVSLSAFSLYLFCILGSADADVLYVVHMLFILPVAVHVLHWSVMSATSLSLHLVTDNISLKKY